jgi:hypothetical protein
MSEERATARTGRMRRRAERATRRRHDGQRDFRAGWALRRLAQAGDQGDADARAAAWDAWTRASTRAIGEFCVHRGLFAGDEFRRIELYALTRLTAQLRAADPDGTRLRCSGAGSAAGSRPPRARR